MEPDILTMQINKKIFKGTLYISSAQFSTKLLLFLLTIFIARHFKQAGFGQYSLAVTIVGFFNLFANYGLGITAFREISKDYSSAGKYFNNVLALRLILSAVSFLLLCAVTATLRYSSEIFIATCVYGITIFSSNILDTYTSVFNAFEKSKYTAIVTVLYNALMLILGLLALRFGLIMLMASSALAGMVAVIAGFYYTKTFVTLRLSDIDAPFCRSLLKESFPLMMLGFIGVIYFRADVVILSKLATSADVGLYNAAYKLMDSFMIISNGIIGSVFPHISRYSQMPLKKYAGRFRKLSLYIFALGLFLAAATFILANKAVMLFFGPSFSGAVPALRVLIWTVPLIYVNAVFLYTLIGFGQQSRLITIVATVTVLNAFLNIMFIPKYGFMASSIITVISEALMCCGYYYLLQKNIKGIFGGSNESLP